METRDGVCGGEYASDASSQQKKILLTKRKKIRYLDARGAFGFFLFEKALEGAGVLPHARLHHGHVDERHQALPHLDESRSH